MKIDPIPSIVRGIFEPDEIKYLEKLGVLVKIDPGDTVMYCCKILPKLFGEEDEKGNQLVPAIIGLSSFCGVPGVDEFVDCGKDLECFEALALYPEKGEMGIFCTFLRDVPGREYKKGEVRAGCYIQSFISSGLDYRNSTPEEIIDHFKLKNPKKWKNIKPVEHVEIPGNDEFFKKLDEIIPNNLKN